jgi:hypothetical protein
MPCHPTDACYCHVIEAGLRNISRLTNTGAAELAATEVEHLRAVTEILSARLLYTPSDARHDPLIDLRYWKQVYPQYLAKADPESSKEHRFAWEALALATLERRYFEAFAKGETPQIS